MSAAITKVVAIAAADAKDIMDAEVPDEDAADEAEEIMTTTIIKKMPCVTIVTRRVTIRLIASRTRKMEMKNPIWFQKRILKIYFNLL
jgi:hypothetical protein